MSAFLTIIVLYYQIDCQFTTKIREIINYRDIRQYEAVLQYIDEEDKNVAKKSTYMNLHK
jgi:hypothetical protein